jgi:cyclohexanone monooxygenase
LIDTNGKGIQQITENGVIANGMEYACDVIIFATGFEYGATSPHTYEHRLGFKLVGRGGLTIGEKWKNGSSTMHGVNVGSLLLPVLSEPN